jgi:murein DD-endopeptidase MepM/ murein hydrolase activator NlpD
MKGEKKMDYWDKRNNKWEEDEEPLEKGRNHWEDDEDDDYKPRSSKPRSPRSRSFSTGFLSKIQKQTIIAVCLFFVVLAAKYNNDFTSGAVYGTFKTALAKDNDYTVALTEVAKGVFGGGGGQVIAVNQSGGDLQLPIQGTIVAKFGKQSPIDKKPNPGIDISAPLGTNVQAPDSGVVLKVGSDPTLGKYIKLEHGSGLISILSNLGEVKVKLNQKVKKGDSLATLGFSSVIKRPWLHWEVYRGSKSIDPEPLLSKPGSKV